MTIVTPQLDKRNFEEKLTSYEKETLRIKQLIDEYKILLAES